MTRREIELVEYQDSDFPIVFKDKVYQLIFQDWDGDLILKDDINGVVITPKAKIDEIEGEIKQISYKGQLQIGDTKYLQSLVESALTPTHT